MGSPPSGSKKAQNLDPQRCDQPASTENDGSWLAQARLVWWACLLRRAWRNRPLGRPLVSQESQDRRSASVLCNVRLSSLLSSLLTGHLHFAKSGQLMSSELSRHDCGNPFDATTSVAAATSDQKLRWFLATTGRSRADLPRPTLAEAFLASIGQGRRSAGLASKYGH